MNCRRVEKLIPLYVEGDLASGKANELASHLEWCGKCNWLADEYKESQSWLRSSETPLFDQPFLADLKRDVLKQVSDASARPSLIASLVQHWSRRQVLALCAAVTIIFGVLLIYLYQTRAHDSRAMHEAVKQAQNGDRDLRPSNLNAVTEPAPGAAFEGKHRPAKHRPPVRKDSRTFLSRRILEPPPSFEAAGNASKDVSSIPGASLDSGDSREILRIEIQTSDPNVRIIWFAPKETDPHQNKPTTD